MALNDKYGVLDAPSSDLMAIRLYGARTSEDTRRIAERLNIERQSGVRPTDQNSILHGLAADHPMVVQFGGDEKAAPSLTNPTTATPPTTAAAPVEQQPKPFRGGSAAFESTQNALGDRMGAMETDEQFYRDTGSAIVNEQRRGNEARDKNNATPGADYRTANPDVALTDAEKAGGASATISQQGKPGQYGVNALPQGFTSYQGRDGGWTIIGRDGKAQKFATEQEAAMWLNTMDVPTLPGVTSGAQGGASGAMSAPAPTLPSTNRPMDFQPGPTSLDPATAQRLGIDTSPESDAAAARRAVPGMLDRAMPTPVAGSPLMRKPRPAPTLSSPAPSFSLDASNAADAAAAREAQPGYVAPQINAPAPFRAMAGGAPAMGSPSSVPRGAVPRSGALHGTMASLPMPTLRPPTKANQPGIERQISDFADQFNPFATPRRVFPY